MSGPALTWEEVCRRRLRAQHLHTPLPAASLHRMVADISGLHAQVMSSAELAAAVRLERLRPGTVAAALWSDRSLVKTWAMRGTLHLLTAEDYPLYVAALSNRRFDLDAPWLKYHGLLASDLPALVDAVSDALDGRQLTREELAGEVVRRLGDPKWETLLASGWGAVLKPAAFQGRLCFGPSEGNRVTFVRPDQWVGPFEHLDPPVLLVDGEIAGVWEHKEDKGRLRVSISPFAPVAPAVADLASVEADRLAAYLGVSADITVGGFVAGRGRKNPGRSSTRREAPMRPGISIVSDQPTTNPIFTTSSRTPAPPGRSSPQ